MHTYYSLCISSISLEAKNKIATLIVIRNLILFDIRIFRSFRFKNKRPLKKLMMVNEGGCPYNQPGVGDISYVKNLMTEEISSKDFPCSVFGAYSHPSAKLGWVRAI